MYAIIETGGKQYKVQEGDIIRVEKLEVQEGDKVTFDKVLAFVSDNDAKFGTPTLENATVEGTIQKNGKSKKILVFKYKPKNNYRRKQGHRQPFTEIKIEKINA